MSNWQKDKTSLDILEFNYATLSKEHYKWFKQACEKAKIKNIQENNKLAGHIKEEYALDRPPDDIIRMLINMVDKRFFKYLDTIRTLTKNLPFDLADVWCNFQKKHEFNPPHRHSGVFSFVIFIKIPYSLNKESKYFTINAGNNYTSKFVFHVIDKFGKIETWPLHVDKSFEGKIVFFPASQVHEVFPFYTSNNYRITVSGNIKLRV